MKYFIETTHLSEIIEKSEEGPVIIFKFSSECGSSSRLRKKMEESNTIHPIYLVTVQKQPELSKKISEMFDIKHETPQIIMVDKGKITYTAHHNNINVAML